MDRTWSHRSMLVPSRASVRNLVPLNDHTASREGPSILIILRKIARALGGDKGQQRVFPCFSWPFRARGRLPPTLRTSFWKQTAFAFTYGAPKRPPTPNAIARRSKCSACQCFCTSLPAIGRLRHLLLGLLPWSPETPPSRSPSLRVSATGMPFACGCARACGQQDYLQHYERRW